MSREKNLFNQIKIALDKKTFIQRIENMASSGFPDCIIIIDSYEHQAQEIYFYLTEMRLQNPWFLDKSNQVSCFVVQ
jgi:hypothetical protein